MRLGSYRISSEAKMEGGPPPVLLVDVITVRGVGQHRFVLMERVLARARFGL
jgi:hypothetical protein